MKILFVCHRFPYPPTRGGKIRPFQMIHHLSRKHSVVVASLTHSQKELSEGAPLTKYCDDVIGEVLPSSIRWMRASKSLLTSRPSSVAYFWAPRLYARIKERLVSSNFDVILVHCAFVAQYVADWKQGYRILDYGDLDSAKWVQYSQRRSLPLSFGYGLEAQKLRQYERETAGRFHCCTVTTQVEKNKFDQLQVSTPCAVIPNGVDTAYFSRKSVARSASTIVFLGRMDYFPNIDGVCHFADKVLPLVRAKMPNVEFRIVGSAPHRKIRQLGKIPGVVVTGSVADVRTYLQDAAVSIAPLRIASGTQNKILESMAMRIPVVATPEAAKGIQAAPGRDLMVADNPETFSKHVLNFLQNAALRERFAAAARAQVERAHLWPISMQILDDLLAEAPATRRRAMTAG